MNHGCTETDSPGATPTVSFQPRSSAARHPCCARGSGTTCRAGASGGLRFEGLCHCHSSERPEPRADVDPIGVEATRRHLPLPPARPSTARAPAPVAFGRGRLERAHPRRRDPRLFGSAAALDVEAHDRARRRLLPRLVLEHDLEPALNRRKSISRSMRSAGWLTHARAAQRRSSRPPSLPTCTMAGRDPTPGRRCASWTR